MVVFKTHEDTPRVLIANSNIVPHWATQENFDRWEREGLIMFGQMTAGSWIYIGTQGILQGTYETFGSLARQKGWGTLKGKLVLTAGLGEMGGAQPLAVTMNEGVVVAVEVDQWRIDRRLTHRYLDVATDNLEEAMTWAEEAKAKGEAKSIGLLGNAAEVLPELVQRGYLPDVVTDQTSAHDPLTGYIPAGMTLAEAAELRERDPRAYQARAMASMAAHVAGDAGVPARRRGGVRLRQQPAPAPRSIWREGRVRLPRLRARLRPTALLRGLRPVPLGGALRRSGGYRGHRPDHPRPVPRK